jgi:hypothetical protein
VLSPTAYELVSIIACGDVSLHTLYLGVLHRHKNSPQAATELLMSGLIELISARCVEWTYPEGLIKEPFRYKQYAPEIIVQLWEEKFGYGPLSTDIAPETITFQLSYTCPLDLNATEYEIYKGVFEALFEPSENT